MEPIFEGEIGLNKFAVYNDKLVYIEGSIVKAFCKEIVIPINQISTIDKGVAIYNWLFVETTAGKRHKFFIKAKEKQSFEDAILKAQHGKQS